MDSNYNWCICTEEKLRLCLTTRGCCRVNTEKSTLTESGCCQFSTDHDFTLHTPFLYHINKRINNGQTKTNTWLSSENFSSLSLIYRHELIQIHKLWLALDPLQYGPRYFWPNLTIPATINRCMMYAKNDFKVSGAILFMFYITRLFYCVFLLLFIVKTPWACLT